MPTEKATSAKSARNPEHLAKSLVIHLSNSTAKYWCAKVYVGRMVVFRGRSSPRVVLLILSRMLAQS